MGWPDGDISIWWIPTIHRLAGKLWSGVDGRRKLINPSNGEIGLFATRERLADRVFGRGLEWNRPVIDCRKEGACIDCGCFDTLFRLDRWDDGVLKVELSSRGAQRKAE